jgi:hypothetical protein
MKDMKDGFTFIWKFKGLRYIIIIGAFINFLSYIAIVLFLPLFQKTADLGSEKYGIAMACFMGGAVAGYLFASIVKMPCDKRHIFFIISNVLSNTALVIAINQHIFFIMAIFLVLGGFFNSIINILLMSSLQLTTPAQMRGKVMAFSSMTFQGLTPFAMALGGILAEFIPIRLIMNACFLIILVVVTPFIFNKLLKRFINFDPERETFEDIGATIS